MLQEADRLHAVCFRVQEDSYAYSKHANSIRAIHKGARKGKRFIISPFAGFRLFSALHVDSILSLEQ